MSYYIRTSGGDLKAKVTDQEAFKLISQCKGRHETTNFKGIGPIGRFVFDKGYEYISGEITLFIFPEDYLHFQEK